jgi:hypothetical protein
MIILNGHIHYYTVVIQYVEPKQRTEWHPTEPDGPFSVLTRGAFKTAKDAYEWAYANLNGTPFTVRRISYCITTK